MVMDLVPPDHRFAALLHDAAEAYLGDMVKPLKNLFPEFSVIEARVMAIIGEKFGLDLTHLALSIKQADLVALATEKRDLMPHSTEPWSYLAEVEPLPHAIAPMSPEKAKEAFLVAYQRFSADISRDQR
jgi:5'-deoxynucleotidase YfbR-like HD superfamily hydrolase